MNFSEKRDKQRAAELDAQSEKADLAARLALSIGDMRRIEPLERRVAVLEEYCAHLVHALLRLTSARERTTSTPTADQLLRALTLFAERWQPWTLEDEER